MLFVGVQFVIWSISGAYMVILDIDYIHGDSLVVKKPVSLKSDSINYALTQLYIDYPQAENIELTTLLGKIVYRFSTNQILDSGTDKVEYLLSADNGELLSPVTEAYAVKIAKSQYENAHVAIRQVRLITENPPFELSARHLPVWRIDFDDFASPSFYISVQTGKLVTKRHSFWRLFDWMFSFHVMDFIEEDASNKLLLVFACLSLLASIFGIILTYFRLFNQRGNTGKNKHKQKVRKVK